jgi:hypothetical protein
MMAKKIKTPLELSEAERNRIDYLIISDNLTDMFTRAKEGDIHAAKATLLPIAHALDPRNEEPIPPDIRGYLSDAFRKILAGMSADMALNLKTKNGRPKTPHKVTLKAAYLVYQGVHEHSLSVEDAVAETVLLINNNLDSLAWYLLGHIEVQEDKLRKWYYSNLSKLERIYQEERDLKVMKP